MPVKTPAEQAAQRDARAFMQLYDPLQIQRGSLPTGSLSYSGYCRRDGTNVTYEHVEADLAVDAPVAKTLLEQAQRASTPLHTASPEWLEQWKKLTETSAPDGSVEKLWYESLAALISPGNAPANIAGALEGAVRASKEAATKAQLARAAELIFEQGAKGVQINANVRLYDANAVERKKLKGRGKTPGQHLNKPRLRVQITNMPVKVIQMAGLSTAVTAGGIRGGVSYQPAQVNRVAAASTNQWVARSALRFMSKPGVPAVLAFGPSAMIDAADSYEYAADGSGRMNWRQFAVNSAKSQSANAVGFATGVLIAGAVAATVSTGGVFLIALAAGAVAQITFNALGGGDEAAALAERSLQR
jgi:hypothetical protein